MTKSSFVMYHDYKQHFDLIEDDSEYRRLLDGIFNYSQLGEEPENLSPIGTMAFSFIKAQLDRDQSKYRKKIEVNRKNGKKGGRPLKNPEEPNGLIDNPNKPKEPSGYSDNPDKPKKANGLIGNPTNSDKPKKGDTDTDTENVTDTDINKSIVWQTMPRPKIPYAEIIKFLNEEANVDFKAKTASTRKFIKARFNEEFSLEDFKLVISAKAGEWMTDPVMVSYLRPSTLFGTKFEGYLQHAKNQSQTFSKDCSNCDYQKRGDCEKSETERLECTSYEPYTGN